LPRSITIFAKWFHGTHTDSPAPRAKMPISSEKTLRGIVPPMVTPLAGEDKLDRIGLEKLTEHLITGGVQGLFVCGTTGEGPSLSYRLRRELLQSTCDQAKGRLPVLMGLIDTSKAEIIVMAEFAARSGATAVVVAPPYYSPLSQADLIRWITAIAGECPLPIYLYNLPNPKHTRYTLETLKICSEIPGVIGFKDSSGDFEFLEATLALFQERPEFGIFVGPEDLLAKSLFMGAHGGISGGANVFPGAYAALYEAFTSGNKEKVFAIQEWIDRFTKQIYSVGDPEASLVRGLKACLSLLNICENCLCSPYISASSGQQEEVRHALRELRNSLAVDHNLLLDRTKSTPFVAPRI
jgi:dihydrodipicolinate synthase/N-acetylneuraminate lyase